jgi:chromate transporter
MTHTLHDFVALALHCMLFSLFAVGGGVSILIPPLHAQFVTDYHWLDERSFAELLAISQATPGPNFLLIPLIGWKHLSWPGAAVAMISFLVLPVTITFFVGRWLHARENALIARFRRAFRPVTGGLWIAAGVVVALSTDHTIVPAAVTIAVFAISMFIDISPFWWCVIAGIAGAALAR